MAQRQPREEPLSRERVLRAAIGLADRDGIGALTMRRLAQELGIEAMSLYHYVSGKDDILAGMVDLVTSEIPLPETDGDWKSAIRQAAIAEFGLIKHAGRQVELCVCGQGVIDVFLALAEEHDEADLMQGRQPGAIRKPLPLRQRRVRHARVDLVRPIRRTDQTGRAATRCAQMCRTEGIDEQNAYAALLQMPRSPRAEHAGADHDHVPLPRRSLHHSTGVLSLRED